MDDTNSDTNTGTGTVTAAELRELVDREQIRDVVRRYCRAIDRRDFELLRTCYHPGAVDQHTGFRGDLEDYIAFLRGELATYAMTQHVIGQQLVEIDGDVARSETYGMAVHWSGTEDGDREVDYTSGFRYVDRMERRDGTWRIAERIAVRDWTRDESGQLFSRSRPGPVGLPSREDPLYRLTGWPADPAGSAG